MFSKKKEEKRRSNSRGGLSQYGLFDIPNISDIGDDNAMDNDDDDDDLEAELLALTSGSTAVRPKRGKIAPPQVNLDAMVAESLRDIPSDEDLSGDEDDPELLNELSNLNEDADDISPIAPEPPPKAVAPQSPRGSSLVAMLEERLQMYQEAEINAKTAGEASRARRIGRGVKTLNDLLKQARAGRVVNEEDIPPPVAVSISKKPADDNPPITPLASPGEETVADAPLPTPPSVPSRPAPPPPSVRTPQPPSAPIILPLGEALEDNEAVPTSPETQAEAEALDRDVVNTITSRRDQYKMAALQAKKNGDMETALKYVKITKQFDRVIAAVESGQPVDLSGMPPPPSGFESSTSQSPQIVGLRENSESQRSADNGGASSAAEVTQEEPIVDDPTLYNAPPPPTSVLEALEQRMAKYKSSEQAAKDEGNSSKARRMGRIVKQYEDAIKNHKAGRPIPIDDLPTPPGFGPIPQDGGAAAAPPPVTPTPSPRVAPMAVTNDTPNSSAHSLTPAVSPRTPGTPSSSSTGQSDPQMLGDKANVRKSPQSRQEKQLSFLISRQKEFKEAAIQAKRKGEVNQAKEYLRLAKGFDPLIEASNCGLPVDMATVPIPPDTKVALESDFDFITVDDCIPGSDAEIFDKLEEDLFKQAKMCLTTRDHFKAIGDVASANRFEQLALHAKKDLDAVRCAHKRSEPIPKFHYETKTFSIVQCCTDLGDNDVELTIVQGINYNVTNPKDVDTYIKFEFPYPSEVPFKERTALIKDTNNPEYNQTFLIPIHRNVRACQRVFKRHSVKLEVWSRGGFLRSDCLIGTAAVKLLPLETKCILHDSFDLMDGRKAVGGKVEVKLRIRNPILTKQVEQVQEKWLIIDQFQ